MENVADIYEPKRYATRLTEKGQKFIRELFIILNKEKKD